MGVVDDDEGVGVVVDVGVGVVDDEGVGVVDDVGVGVVDDVGVEAGPGRAGTLHNFAGLGLHIAGPGRAWAEKKTHRALNTYKTQIINFIINKN